MLVKSKMTNFGIEAKIWKLGYISLDRVAKYGSITMNLYLTEDASQYIESIVEPIKEELFDQYFESGRDTYEACEQYMLDNNEFFHDGTIQTSTI